MAIKPLLGKIGPHLCRTLPGRADDRFSNKLRHLLRSKPLGRRFVADSVGSRTDRAIKSNGRQPQSNSSGSISLRSSGVFLSARRNRLGHCLRKAQTHRSSGSGIRLIVGIDPEYGERPDLDLLCTRSAPAYPIHGTPWIHAYDRRGLLNDRGDLSLRFHGAEKNGIRELNLGSAGLLTLGSHGAKSPGRALRSQESKQHPGQQESSQDQHSMQKEPSVRRVPGGDWVR